MLRALREKHPCRVSLGVVYALLKYPSTCVMVKMNMNLTERPTGFWFRELDSLTHLSGPGAALPFPESKGSVVLAGQSVASR